MGCDICHSSHGCNHCNRDHPIEHTVNQEQAQRELYAAQGAIGAAQAAYDRRFHHNTVDSPYARYDL